MSAPALLSVFIGIQLALACFFFKRSKKRQQQDKQERIQRVKYQLRDPDMVKVVLWIKLVEVNGEVYDRNAEYTVSLKNGILIPGGLAVALFKPGEYCFTVSANCKSEFQHVKVNATLFPGQVYQLGCNSKGPYFVIDPHPERYEYCYQE